MTGDTTTFLTIFGMALATYLTRIGGLMLMRRVNISPGVEAWLKQIPPAVIISIIAPSILDAGPAEKIAGAVALAVGMLSRSLLITMVAGVLAVYLARLVLA